MTLLTTLITTLGQISDVNILFIGMGIGLTCGLGIYLIKYYSIDIPISDGTITPKTFNITQDQLSNIPNVSNQSIQTSPILEDFTKICEKGIQAVSDVKQIRVQVQPVLNIDTTHLNPGFKDWTTYSHSEKLVQTLIDKSDVGVQTLFSNLNREVENKINLDWYAFNTSPKGNFILTMFFLIITVILVIYYISGLWSVLNLILLIINYIIITYEIERKGNNNWLIIMQISCIFMILFIVIINFKLLILKIFL